MSAVSHLLTNVERAKQQFCDREIGTWSFKSSRSTHPPTPDWHLDPLTGHRVHTSPQRQSSWGSLALCRDVKAHRRHHRAQEPRQGNMMSRPEKGRQWETGPSLSPLQKVATITAMQPGSWPLLLGGKGKLSQAPGTPPLPEGKHQPPFSELNFTSGVLILHCKLGFTRDLQNDL